MKKAFLSLFLLMLPIVANAADGRELYLELIQMLHHMTLVHMLHLQHTSLVKQ